jgi:DNA repair protein RecN (Recombination protein N)
MLTLLKIRNIALIDSLEIEFAQGLNLLTGETGSGKSIIVDSLGALTGERVSSDFIKEGQQAAQIEGLFAVPNTASLRQIFEESGIELDEGKEADIIVRRELSTSGKNRIFVNNQLVTQGFLKKVGPFFVDIHGQGEQAALFDPSTHLEMLDEYADLGALRQRVAENYRNWSATRAELGMLSSNEAEKLQMLDILRFQASEIKAAGLKPGEDQELEEEKRRLNNVEKLSSLSEEAYGLLYERDEATVGTLEKAARCIEELAEYEPTFRDYIEGLRTAQAVLEDLAITTRDFRNHLEFSPERLAEIENRLAEISRLTRKYGGSIESVLEHLRDAEERMANIETSEFREEELKKKLHARRIEFISAASDLSKARAEAAKRFEKAVAENLKAVALEKARFEVRVEQPTGADLEEESGERRFSSKGFDKVEFFFSANIGESPKPLSRVASGGEASRLMLILKTTAKAQADRKAVVFDEIDVGIGGRVAEAVGRKLKQLSATQQVLCVTHQPQVAALADKHFLVTKEMGRSRTEVSVAELDENDRIGELARMLAGKTITETARTHAREMLQASRGDGKARRMRK